MGRWHALVRLLLRQWLPSLPDSLVAPRIAHQIAWSTRGVVRFPNGERLRPVGYTYFNWCMGNMLPPRDAAIALARTGLV
ncbi:hypothetical protein CGRA01v4_06495 [Colletotrichum graminicola]|nr:hypothetical protein CGRA01v4_06495 [Colletotrichum graminicola]